MKSALIIAVGLSVLIGSVVFVATRGDRAPEDGVAEDASSTEETGLRWFADASGPEDLTLAARTVSFADGTEASFRVADDFEVTVAAEGLGKARFMTMSPDGRLFVPDMVDYALSHEGRVIVLDDFNESTGEFETEHTYLAGLRGPNNVFFYTDAAGQEWLYLTLTEHIVRYPYEAGDTEPSGEPEVVYEFPNAASPNADSAVWHLTRTAVLHDGTLYVGVGSGCNACEQEADEMRAMILAMNPDGTDARVYADGIKNPVGLVFADGELYATENGTDHLGADAPDDLVFRVRAGAHYGWPYCYEVGGEKRLDATRTWEGGPADCSDVPLSFTAFAAHSAPIGITYFEADAPAALRGAFLVALQGSWNPEIGNGYQLVRLSRDGEQTVFMDGFMSAEGERIGQPVHILQKDANSFFVTDDYNGRIYYLRAAS